nr:EOG090X0FQ9 [Macrothrix elegans]
MPITRYHEKQTAIAFKKKEEIIIADKEQIISQYLQPPLGSQYQTSSGYSQYTGSKRFWIRKPLGSPMAKSKIFKIPQKPVLPEDEKAEIKRLYDNYKNHMKSIRQYFYEQSLKQAESGESAQLKLKQEEEEHMRLMEENLLENSRIAELREARLKAEAEKSKAKVLATLSKKEEIDKKLELNLKAFIEKQQATPFIKVDEIEKAIEIALANPVDFNFAIDLNGYVYRGKETNINNIPEEQRERLPGF